ncbi:hypothetical protein LEP1GSC185_1306 [Leptospira licerasiae serovar Varillal str. VAR 010]|uniref:Uncharacterized protein n=1 Tax=Leptospira licerasiae str. MMD4847 TaxID=1049971 RepID=A0ABP2RIN4_9LEPT|nr:hypothetical protein LEP1GSC185_1306 [Leptospira licerasiae serovar Varillal str. VAR 010]EJZ43383.1 hypothetical protein LEP1GSC178_3234 [Leptospira licerasiae str. MMD4847]
METSSNTRFQLGSKKISKEKNPKRTEDFMNTKLAFVSEKKKLN